jgi:hypothetical protein
MKEADLFRQYAHEAARSSSTTSQAEKDEMAHLHVAQAALMSERVGSRFTPRRTHH